MDAELARRLVEFVEKVGLLKRDLQHRGDLPSYEARGARIEQKIEGLIETLAGSDPEVAKAISTAWHLPARSLAFRNAEHQKDSTD